MSIDQAITLIEQMLKTALMVGGPVLVTAFVVGVLISVFPVFGDSGFFCF